MTKHELAMLVREMRAAQKRFFAAAHGSPEKAEAVAESRRLERAVDREVGEVISGQEQGALFPVAEGGGE